jgi:hypothetical protein
LLYSWKPCTPGLIALGVFLVNDAAPAVIHARRRLHHAAVSDTVPVLLLPASTYVMVSITMRMPWKACKVILGHVVTEIIEQQKWIEVLGVSKSEGAAEVNSRTLESGFGFDEPLNWANGHVKLQC